MIHLYIYIQNSSSVKDPTLYYVYDNHHHFKTYSVMIIPKLSFGVHFIPFSTSAVVFPGVPRKPGFQMLWTRLITLFRHL